MLVNLRNVGFVFQGSQLERIVVVKVKATAFNICRVRARPSIEQYWTCWCDIVCMYYVGRRLCSRYLADSPAVRLALFYLYIYGCDKCGNI